MSLAHYRILRPDDARALATLHAGAFTTPWSPAAFRSELAKSSVFALARLAPTPQEQLASICLFQVLPGEAEILTLATDTAYQRRGYALSLLKTAFEHLTARGIKRILLDVAADNQPALRFYQSLGFTEDGRRKAYYKRQTGPAIDAILMSYDMTGLH